MNWNWKWTKKRVSQNMYIYYIVCDWTSRSEFAQSSEIRQRSPALHWHTATRVSLCPNHGACRICGLSHLHWTYVSYMNIWRGEIAGRLRTICFVYFVRQSTLNGRSGGLNVTLTVSDWKSRAIIIIHTTNNEISGLVYIVSMFWRRFGRSYHNWLFPRQRIKDYTLSNTR